MHRLQRPIPPPPYGPLSSRLNSLIPRARYYPGPPSRSFAPTRPQIRFLHRPLHHDDTGVSAGRAEVSGPLVKGPSVPETSVRIGLPPAEDLSGAGPTGVPRRRDAERGTGVRCLTDHTSPPEGPAPPDAGTVDPDEGNLGGQASAEEPAGEPRPRSPTAAARRAGVQIRLGVSRAEGGGEAPGSAIVAAGEAPCVGGASRSAGPVARAPGFPWGPGSPALGPAGRRPRRAATSACGPPPVARPGPSPRPRRYPAAADEQTDTRQRRDESPRVRSPWGEDRAGRGGPRRAMSEMCCPTAGADAGPGVFIRARPPPALLPPYPGARSGEGGRAWAPPAAPGPVGLRRRVSPAAGPGSGTGPLAGCEALQRPDRSFFLGSPGPRRRTLGPSRSPLERSLHCKRSTRHTSEARSPGPPPSPPFRQARDSCAPRGRGPEGREGTGPVHPLSRRVGPPATGERQSDRGRWGTLGVAPARRLGLARGPRPGHDTVSAGVASRIRSVGGGVGNTE